MSNFLCQNFEDDLVIVTNVNTRHTGYKPFEHMKGINKFAFVRNPIDWYASYWAFKMKWRWKPGFNAKFDGLCESYDFPEFINNVVTKYPTFYQDTIVNLIGEKGDKVTFVGKYENLHVDFKKMLSLSGLGVFTLKSLHDFMPINVSKESKKVIIEKTYSKELKIKIAEQNQLIAKWFDYDLDKIINKEETCIE